MPTPQNPNPSFLASLANLIGLPTTSQYRPLDIRQLQRPSEPYLRQQFPATYGFLGGLMGTAPDQFAGSVLDPISARVKAGAEYGFPLGIATQMLPAAPLTRGLPVGASTKAVGGMDFLGAQPMAPVSPAGFYSAAEQAALNLQRGKGSGQAFINDLMKAPDVKKDELQATGLLEAFAARPQATKQEVIDYLQANKVNMGETVLGGKQAFDVKRLNQLESEYKALRQHPIDDPSFGEEKYDELIRLMNIRDQSTTHTLYDAAEQATRKAQQAQRRGDRVTAEKYFRESEFLNTRAEKLDLRGQGMDKPPKFGQYTLPGGENYREVLLTLPNQWEKPRALQEANSAKIRQLREQMHGTSGTNEIRAEISRLHNENKLLQQQITEAPIYKSSHWEQPNVLAHIRMNDRVDVDGKKMSLIEEIQSDWHQAGREKGYGPKMETSVEAYYETKSGQRVPIGFGKTKEEAEASIDVGWKNMVDIKYDTIERKVGEGVPDAPMKDTWYQTALRKAVKDAIDNGADRVGITTGARQAKRYDLSKQIDTLSTRQMNDGYYMVVATDKNGKTVIENAVKEDALPDVVGKELAKKIISDKGGDYSGLDLSVGGEGMKKYYDEIYPKYLDKFAKKYGSSVKETKIDIGNKAPSYGLPSTAEFEANRLEGEFMPDYIKRMKGTRKTETVRYIDITPQMREAFGGKGKGVPLFSAAPAIPLALDEDTRKQINAYFSLK